MSPLTTRERGYSHFLYGIVVTVLPLNWLPCIHVKFTTICPYFVLIYDDEMSNVQLLCLFHIFVVEIILLPYDFYLHYDFVKMTMYWIKIA